MAKGIDVARSFFDGWGLPYLRSGFPHLADRVAAVLCHGSQCLGNDDELSRDHGWGPQFSLVLTGSDMSRWGRQLQRRINADAPAEWDGFPCKLAHDIDVTSINPWFRKLLGRARPATTNRDWYHHTDEHGLCMLAHAPVFHDPLGEWSRRREGFASYPDLVWQWRARDDLWNVWHFGQYNFLQRLTHRRDPVSIELALAKAAEGAMRLCLVLHHQYRPYWKWLAAQFRKLDGVDELDGWLRALTSTADIDAQASLMERICADVHGRVVAAFDLDPNPTGHPHPLLLDHEALAEQGRREA